MKPFCPLVMLLAITLWITGDTLGQTGENIPQREGLRVLIVDGFSNHDWQATTQAIIQILEDSGSWKIDVSTVPPQQNDDWQRWNPDFKRYDVVIQNTNDINGNGAWPETAKSSLEAYVENGGGLLIFHSANNAFVNWKAYNEMIGLGWRNKDFGPAIIIENDKPIRIPSGEGKKTGHGSRADTVITRLGDHPIHNGLPRQWMAADIEVYRYARGPVKNLTVLSYAQDAATGLNFPTEWVVAYGKGRVYNSTFGHYWHGLTEVPPGIRCNGFRSILPRASLWLADRAVPETVPDDFPQSTQVSLKNLDD